MTVTTRSSKLKSNKIATRSSTNQSTDFVQLPYQKKHKTKRQKKHAFVPVIVPVVLEEDKDDIKDDIIVKDDDDDDGEKSIVSEYSIIPERNAFSEGEEEDQDHESVAVKGEEDDGYGPDLYSVSVDFDEARSEWMENKKRLANGNYVYLCGKVTNGGNKCRRGCSDGIGLYSGCAIHFMWEEKLQHYHV